MKAAILSIGDELALGQNLNTNSRWLAEELAAAGVITIEHRTVDDDRRRIADAVRDLAAKYDVLILTGGLGPTDEYLTRESLNDVLAPGQPLVADEEAMAWLDLWFARRGKDMPQSNRRQAMRPEPMRCLPNPNGTAPGLAGKLDSCLLFALPGPPREMQSMFRQHLLPALPRDEGGDAIVSAQVNEFGLGESVAAERLGALTSRARHPLIGTTASESIVSARIRARGPREEVEPLVEADCTLVQDKWWPYAFSRGEESLPEVVGRLLKERSRTLASAESCTGGWLGKALVDVAGSSEYYVGGWVTYSNEMKTQMLGVPADLIEEHGAVSREVAEAMACGALEKSGADEAVAITGIAGPDGGSEEKPVGTVHIAIARRVNEVIDISARHFAFAGDRMTIRDRSVKAALQMLRFALLDVDDGHTLLWQVADDEQPSESETDSRPQNSAAGANAEQTSPVEEVDDAHAVDAYIALGSNLGDRASLLASALKMLRESPGVDVLMVSTLIETDPVGPPGQGTYLNAAAKLRTSLSARELLDLLLEIERRHGRDRKKEQRWGPRRLDLDLLLYGEAILNEPGLTLPHPRMHERAFVLEPLAQIAANVRHPFFEETVQSLRDRLLAGRSGDGIR